MANEWSKPTIDDSADELSRPGTGSIAAFIGPEGSGKDTSMTAFACRYFMHGFKVFAFPGYHLKRGGKGIHAADVVSEEMTPEDWVNLPKDLHDIVIMISEADSHFNSYDGQQYIARKMTSLLKQRRKRSLVILYNVQNWAWFNNRMRWLTHLVFQCWDMYWSTRGTPNAIPRGRKLLLRPYDCKGFYTGKEWTPGKPIFVDGKGVWDNFDTYEVTTDEESASSVKVQRTKRTIKLNEDGDVIPNNSELPPSGSAEDMKEWYKQLQNYDFGTLTTQKENRVKEVIGSFLQQGNMIPRKLLVGALDNLNIKIGSAPLGAIIHKMNGYLISGRDGADSIYTFPTTMEQSG
jgi:hypothetical protein